MVMRILVVTRSRTSLGGQCMRPVAVVIRSIVIVVVPVTRLAERLQERHGQSVFLHQFLLQSRRQRFDVGGQPEGHLGTPAFVVRRIAVPPTGRGLHLAVSLIGLDAPRVSRESPVVRILIEIRRRWWMMPLVVVVAISVVGIPRQRRRRVRTRLGGLPRMSVNFESILVLIATSCSDIQTSR